MLEELEVDELEMLVALAATAEKSRGRVGVSSTLMNLSALSASALPGVNSWRRRFPIKDHVARYLCDGAQNVDVTGIVI